MVKSKTLDFTNVKDRSAFNPRRVREGDYLAKIILVDDHTTDEGNDGWVFAFEPVKKKGAVYPYYCMFGKKQLWKIRNLLLAAGVKVPKAKKQVDPTKAVGKLVGITLEDDEYDGKPKSTIVNVFPASELDDDDEKSDDVDDAEDEDDDVEAESDDEDEDDDESDDDDEDEPEDDYDSWSLKKLKTEAREKGHKIKKGMEKSDIIDMLRSSDDDDDEDDDEEVDEDEV